MSSPNQAVDYKCYSASQNLSQLSCRCPINAFPKPFSHFTPSNGSESKLDAQNTKMANLCLEEGALLSPTARVFTLIVAQLLVGLQREHLKHSPALLGRRSIFSTLDLDPCRFGGQGPTNLGAICVSGDVPLGQSWTCIAIGPRFEIHLCPRRQGEKRALFSAVHFKWTGQGGTWVELTPPKAAHLHKTCVGKGHQARFWDAQTSEKPLNGMFYVYRPGRMFQP